MVSGLLRRAVLFCAAALLVALAAMPAQAATYPCAVGPADIATLHFTNAGDGSYQNIGVTVTNITNTSGGCHNLSSTTAIRPYENDGVGRPNLNDPLFGPGVTVQGGGQNRVLAGEIDYKPPSAGFSGTDSFTIDNNNIARLITVNVIVDGPKPVATAFTSTAVAYNSGSASATSIDLSGHVTFSPTSYAVGSATTAQGGTVSVNAAGIASYKPAAGFRGTDSFTFTATNSSGTSNSVTVTVPVSNPVLTIGLSATTGTIGTALSGVSITASGGKAAYSCATTPVTGSLPAGVTLAANCTLSGTPTTAATSNFTVNVTDSSTGTGAFTQASGTLSFTVAKATSATALVSNNNPSIQNASVTFTATVTGFGTPTGTVTFKDGATTLGTPALTAGVATFSTSSLSVASHSITATYSGDTNNATSVSNTVTQVVNLPAPPIVAAASANVSYNTAKAIDLSASITGGPHTAITVASGPAHGTTSVAGDVVTYTPTSGYFGSDSFTYTATGPGGTSAAATVTLTVANPPAPTVAAASANVSFNTAKAIDLSGSITGVHTAITVASGPAHGTTSVAGDIVTYTPTSGYFGSDSFTYTATGPGGTSSAATVTLTVATPAAPTVAAASANVTYNTAKAIDLSGSITGVHTAITVASGPAHGTTSVAGDVVTYTPTSGYIGSDSFTYTATGPGGTSSAATVTLTVAAPPAPTVSAASTNVAYETAKAIDLSGSITGIHTAITVASGPAHGTTSVAGDVVTYTPTSGYFGADSFTYTATGPGGTSAAATVTITVAAPVAPTVAAASASVAYNTPKPIDLSGSITGVHSSIAVASGPAHGTTSVSGDVVTYTPTSGYFGSDSFTYTATGPGGTSAAATVTLTVATPAAPTVAAASTNVTYETAKAIDLSGSITGVHTSIAVASGPAHGTTSVAGDVVTYTPTSGYFGSDSFTYTATGPGGTSSAATVTLTVATPAAPTVAAASASVSFNTAKAIDLASAITGVHTSITVASGPAHGTTSVSGDVVTYTPTSGYFGSDSFTYTATGPGGTSSAATVTLTIATPGAPTVAPASASVSFNTAKAIDLSGSITGVHSAITVESGPAHGTTSVSGDVVTYTPTSGYFGSDSFTYTATGPGGTSASATVTLTIATPAAPTVAAASASVAYNTPKPIDLSGAITGVHTAINIASGPAHGTTSISGDTVTYTPTSGYFGSDSFTYTATGPGGTSAPATVTLTVATPAAPTVAAASASVSYNTAKAIDLSASITGVHTSIAVASGPAHGTTSVAGDVVTYTPTSGYFGSDSFTYTATGPGGTSSAATVTLTVATPAAPTVAAASANVSYNTAKPIDLSGSITGVHTSIAVASGPAHGTTSVAGDVVTYTPTSGYFGSDSFTYTATGPGGTSAAATVTLTVAAPAAPTVAAASASVAYNTAKAIDLSGSITGAHTSIAVASGPAHGTTSIAGDVVTYTPTSGYFGSDSFTYTATGPGGTSAAATVTLTIASPGAPVAAAASASVSYNTAKPIDLSTSITGVHSSIAVASGPAHGTTSVAGDVVTYTPTSGYFGSDSFTYTATGPGGTSAAATVSLTVATPAAPTAAAASASVTYDTAKAIDLSTSITGVHSSIAIASGPTHGTTSVSGDVVSYTPTSGYFGTDSFTYTATGPGGTSAPATVTLTVATPAAPVAAAASASVAHDTAKAIDLSSSITGPHTSIAVASGPAHGTTSVAGDVVTYTPTSGYSGSDSFTYTATGPGGTSAPATVTLTVATAGVPVVAAASASVNYNTAKAIDLSGSITGTHSSIAVASVPAHGTTSVSGDVVTYTPTSGYFGADSFTYTATGPGGTSSAATVTLTIATPGAPTVAAASASVAFNTATPINLAASIAGVHSSIAVASGPTHGTTSVAGDVVTYTPTSGYSGSDSFTYTATGPGGTSAAAAVTLTVASPGAAPVAAAVSATVTYNTAKPIDLSGSITGTHTSIAVASAPAHGTTGIAGDIVTYTPTSGYSGSDSFTYTATGPGGTSAAATVTLTINPPAAPTVAPVSTSVLFHTAKAINLAGAITGVHTAIAIATGPAHGSTSVAGDVVTYTPVATYFGGDSFTYTATGPGGMSSAATVTLTIAPPLTPIVTPVSANVDYNTAKAIDLTASITGTHSAVTVASPPTHGTTSVAGNIVTYTPAAGYIGSDSFTYTATGPSGPSTPATVSLTIAAPAAPSVAAASANVDYGTPKAINLSGSITGIHTAVAVTTAPAHGTTSVAGDVVTYTPASGYSGPDSFSYAATGPGGSSAAAAVTITVAAAVPPATIPASTQVTSTPVQSGGGENTNASTNINLSNLVTGFYTDIVIVTPPHHGKITLIGDAPGASARSSSHLPSERAALAGITAVYTPDPGYFGPDSFSFIAVGPGGSSAPAQVSIEVVGNMPVVQPKTASTTDNQRVSIDLTAGATNGPFTGATIVSVTPADSATTAIVQGGTTDAPTYRLDVTPKPRFGGQIVVIYHLQNQFGPSADGTATITVTARPDPSADPTVRAISDAQAETARNFSRTQVDNFMRRTEDLHGRGGHRSDMGARLALDALVGGRTMMDDPRDNNRTHGLDILHDESLRAATDARRAADDADAAASHKAAGGSSGSSPGALAFWTGGALEIGHRDATSNRAKMNVSTSGLSGGVDMKAIDGLIVGVGGGYGRDVTKIAHDAGRVSGHDAVGAAYFSATPIDGAFIDGVAGYGDIRFHTRRVAATTGSTATGSRDGNLGFASLSTGLDRSNSTLRWSLYGRGDYERAVLDAYTETGAGLYDLRFGRRIVNSLTGVLGGRVSLIKPIAGGSYMPSLRAEWSHEFQGSSRQMVDYADIAGPALFGIETLDWGREQYSLSLDNEFNFNSWVIGAELGARAAEKERSGTVRLSVKKRF